METNGFTGYNSGLARRNLDDFRTSMNSALESLNNSFQAYCEGLTKYWGAPTAVEFNNTAERFQHQIADAVPAANNILYGAVRAVSGMAARNGSSFAYGESIRNIDASYSHLKDVLDTGVIGMDITAVRNSTEQFNNEVKAGIAKLDNVPMSIALYDPNGAIVATYRGVISKLKANIIDSLNAINASINSAIEAETVRVEKAKEQAASVLGGH